MESLIPTLATLLSAIGAEALKTFGAYAISLIILCGGCWYVLLQNRGLRTELSDLNKARLDDAKQMIRVTEASTAMAATRAQGDQQHADLVRNLITVVSKIEARQSGIEENRRLLESLAERLPRRRAPAPRRESR